MDLVNTFLGSEAGRKRVSSSRICLARQHHIIVIPLTNDRFTLVLVTSDAFQADAIPWASLNL